MISDEELIEDLLEKSADEMFEELGYKKEIIESEVNNDVTIMYIKSFVYEYESKIINFELNQKKIEIEQDIDMQELKAINKKCKELRLAMSEEDIKNIEYSLEISNYLPNYIWIQVQRGALERLYAEYIKLKSN